MTELSEPSTVSVAPFSTVSCAPGSSFICVSFAIEALPCTVMEKCPGTGTGKPAVSKPWLPSDNEILLRITSP